MKTKSHLIVFFTLLLLLSACVSINGNSIRGSGSLSSEDRPVKGITGVSLTTLGDLTIQLGEAESLVIEAEDNLLPYLETKVQGGTLIIQTSNNTNLQPTRTVRYTLTVKSLDSLETSSSGNITAPALKGGAFSIRSSSSGDISLKGLTADSLKVNLSSSGNVDIASGEVGAQNITVSSSGDYRAGEVRCQSADVLNSSSGNVTIWVTDTLTVTLSSSGNVEYFGKPNVTQNTSSSGNAVSLGDK